MTDQNTLQFSQADTTGHLQQLARAFVSSTEGVLPGGAAASVNKRQTSLLTGFEKISKIQTDT